VALVAVSGRTFFSKNSMPSGVGLSSARADPAESTRTARIRHRMTTSAMYAGRE
jgi:hypothetical protein